MRRYPNLLLAAVLVIGLIALGMVGIKRIYDIDRNGDACESRGGVYVQTHDGYRCISKGDA